MGYIRKIVLFTLKQEFSVLSTVLSHVLPFSFLPFSPCWTTSTLQNKNQAIFQGPQHPFDQPDAASLTLGHRELAWGKLQDLFCQLVGTSAHLWVHSTQGSALRWMGAPWVFAEFHSWGSSWRGQISYPWFRMSAVKQEQELATSWSSISASWLKEKVHI